MIRLSVPFAWWKPMVLWKSLVRSILKIDPSAPALEFRCHWYSWQQLADAMAQIAIKLDDYGIPVGGRVGVLQRNRAELVPVILELLTSGKCLVTLNPLYPDQRLHEDILKAQPAAIIGSSDDLSRTSVANATAQIGAAALSVSLDSTDFVVANCIFPQRHLWARPIAPGTSVEMLTSGTTGTPKRIAMNTSNFEKSILSYLSFESGGEEPRLRSGVQILTAPFSHIGGLGRLLGTITGGHKSCLLEKFEVNAFLDAVRRHQPKVAWAAPAALRMLLEADVPREALACLVTMRSGSAALEPELSDAFFDRFGIPVLQNYGATEFGGVAGWTMQDFKKYRTEKRGSVGRLNNGVHGRCVEAGTNATVPPGTRGILELQGEGIGNGVDWIRTTDIASIDADGFVWIHGRGDDAIVRGGFKVSPADVVAAMQAHPAIKIAAVVGIPDARLGEVPAALYELNRNSSAPSDDDLRAFLKERLLPYQIPTRFKVVGSIPKNHVMKLDRLAAQDLFRDSETTFSGC